MEVSVVTVVAAAAAEDAAEEAEDAAGRAAVLVTGLVMDVVITCTVYGLLFVGMTGVLTDTGALTGAIQPLALGPLVLPLALRPPVLGLTLALVLALAACGGGGRGGGGVLDVFGFFLKGATATTWSGVVLLRRLCGGGVGDVPDDRGGTYVMAVRRTSVWLAWRASPPSAVGEG